MKYILASGSPRRRQLLEQIGITEFEILPSHLEEQITRQFPSEIVEELSIQKSMDIAESIILKRNDSSSLSPGYLLIGADTVVARQEQILGKPQNRKEAFAMLSELSGHSHSVFTGVTLLRIAEGQILARRTFHEETKVFMRPYTSKEINTYIDSGEPMDKAGAYGIQGMGAILVERIEGDYNNVVGLPISRLYQELKQFC